LILPDFRGSAGSETPISQSISQIWKLSQLFVCPCFHLCFHSTAIAISNWNSPVADRFHGAASLFKALFSSH